MRPISQPKLKLSSKVLNLYVWATIIQPKRKTNATSTIQRKEVRTCHQQMKEPGWFVFAGEAVVAASAMVCPVDSGHFHL